MSVRITNQKLSRSSKEWLQEHMTDHYVQRAQKDGYRSRAAYKLLEIQQKDRLSIGQVSSSGYHVKACAARLARLFQTDRAAHMRGILSTANHISG